MSGLCRPSRWEDVPQLKGLWKTCFGDDDTYIDHYFIAYYLPSRALVLTAEGQIATMLLTFPFTLTGANGDACSACYIYAFCTAPELQGRGYGRRLLAYAEEQAALAGCQAAIMVPGEGSLFTFYEQLGYETAFFCWEKTLSRGAAGPTLPRPCDLATYTTLREKWLTDQCHVTYPLPVLDYQRSLCRNSGGGFYALEDGVAAIELDENTLVIKELLASDLCHAASSLMSLFGLKTAVVRLPVQRELAPSTQAGGDIRRFGVIKWFSSDHGGRWDNAAGYLAFAFD